MRIARLEIMGMMSVLAILGMLIALHGVITEVAYGTDAPTGIVSAIIKALPALLILGSLAAAAAAQYMIFRGSVGVLSAVVGVSVGIVVFIMVNTLATDDILVGASAGYQTDSKSFPLVATVTPLIPILYGIGLLLAALGGVVRSVSRAS